MDLNKVVYYCPNCGKTVSRLKHNKDKCSNCGGSIVQTEIDVENWKQFSDEQKDIIKKEIDKYGLPNFSGEPLYDLKNRYEFVKTHEILVTTTDINKPYDIIGPVFYQINDAGSGKMIYKKQVEYRSILNNLKDSNQMTNQSTSITEVMGSLAGVFELLQTGNISESTKDLMGNNHQIYDEAFFISIEELKKRAFLMGADAIIGMREELNLDTNGFQHFYMQMYGTAIKFKK